MPEYINEAVIFIENESGVTVVTDFLMLDTKEQLSYVIAGVKPDANMEDEKVNLIKSVYALDDFISIISKAAANDNLVIIDKQKAQTILTTVGVQPSEVSRLFELSRDSLSQNTENINNQNKVYLDAEGEVTPCQKGLIPTIQTSVIPSLSPTSMTYIEKVTEPGKVAAQHLRQ